MSEISQQFIDFALDYQVLQFGEFTLKSGRISPYFFNAGLFNDGRALAKLGELYAQLIIEANVDFDMLFGPAYKGIPLIVSVGIALAKQHDINKPIAFNRKQAKDYGDKGTLIGAPMRGNVLLIDDVITAGTAIRQSQELLLSEPAEITAVMVALDRQERGQGPKSSIQELEETGIKVYSLAKLEDIIQHLTLNNENQFLPAIQAYQQEYGIN